MRPDSAFPPAAVIDINVDEVREAIRDEYKIVAEQPDKGFHFHTGRKLAGICGYRDEWLEGIPETAIESFAGTGNPFAIAELELGARIVDVGSGDGIDSLIAAKMVGPGGAVIGVDMTPEMLDRARRAASEAGFGNVEFADGFMEELPVDDGWADVVISNGVFNLTPRKPTALAEWFRVLKPGGRLQIADIMVEKEVAHAAKQNIALWTG